MFIGMFLLFAPLIGMLLQLLHFEVKAASSLHAELQLFSNGEPACDAEAWVAAVQKENFFDHAPRDCFPPRLDHDHSGMARAFCFVEGKASRSKKNAIACQEMSADEIQIGGRDGESTAANP